MDSLPGKKRGRLRGRRGSGPKACRVSLGLVLLVAACARERPELVRVPEASPPAILISDVAVLDVEEGVVEKGRDVLITGERIARIAAAGEIAAPDGSLGIAGAGATILPGLIDMHGHVGNASEPSWITTFPDPEANLRAYLYCGVTTLLDPADLSSQAFARRDAVARGEIPGPTIYTAGPMVTAPGGHPIALLEQLAPWWIRWYLLPRAALPVDSPAEARSAVASLREMGADVVKLAVDRIPGDAPRIRNDVLEAAVAESKAHGLRAVAHIGTTEDAIDSARAGVSAWMHGVYKERIPDERIEELAAFGIPMVPTITVFESYALLGSDERDATALERETVAAPVLEAFRHVPPDAEAVQFFETFLRSLRTQRQNWRENVRRLHAAGVTILAGSDTQTGVFPGAGLHRELRYLVESGLTPVEAIRAATSDAARFLAGDGDPDFGRIGEGRRADLLLVDGDPTRDVETLSRIRAVIKSGKVLERTPVAAPPQ